MLGIIKSFLFASIILAVTGCMKDDMLPVSPVDLYGSRGVFIVNEGNYLYGNGSLSYYDSNSKEVINSVYSLANGVPLGDVAYSMTIYNGKSYVAVNNSSSIQVVDANTLLHLGTITDLPSPRHILFLNDERALVSDLYARGISIINPKTLSVIGKINTGGASMPFYQHSTENLIKIGNKVFTNCWSFDNKVLVISTESLAVVDSIEVGIQPLAMVKDKNNNLWVINDGGYAGNPVGHEIPSLMRINSQSHQVEFRLNFPSLNDIVGQIATTPAGDSLYYISNNIYKIGIDETELQLEPIIYKNSRNFRALGIDPITGEIYVSDAIDFMSEGKVYRYRSNGAAVDTFDVGIIPGSFCFN